MNKTMFCIVFCILAASVSSADALMIKFSPESVNTADAATFDISVMIQDVSDLGAFQFDIRYDPAVLTARDNVVFGSFLGSTGRMVTELPSDIDNDAGRLTAGAFSSGSGAGPNGTGILATVTFDVKKLSDSHLVFEAVQITDTGGLVLSPALTTGQIVPRYHISSAAGAGGSISPSGDVLVKPAGNQTFSVQPSACYHIADVKADGVSKGAVSQHIFDNVSGNHTIQAFFDINRFVITACTVTNGSISPAGNVTVACGQNQKFIITPDQGFRIKDVQADGVSQGRISEYTFPPITSGHNICAEFYPAVSGDIDGNDAVDLRDAILGLQILCGIDIGTQKIFTDADVNGDGRIGIEELMFILQKISTLR